MSNNIDFMKMLLPAPRNGGFRMEGYWIWCGSVIKGEDNRYHMFASRWSKELPFHPGWLIGSEIVRAVSDKPEGPYTFQEVVLVARGAQYFDGRMTHNPHITKYKDTYILFYTGSTHPFEEVQEGEIIDLNNPRIIVSRSNKRIGMATSKSIFGPWKRLEEPILKTRPNKYDSFFTSNPAPFIEKDGSVTLVYKARAYKEKPYDGQIHGKMCIGVARADNYEGPYKAMGDNAIFDADQFNMEDPFIYKTEGNYHMVGKDMTGKICGEYHGGIYASSVNGIIWNLIFNKKSYSRRVLWDDGVFEEMGSLERPFILIEEGVPTHLFFATADGIGGFDNASNTWNMVIPLK